MEKTLSKKDFGKLIEALQASVKKASAAENIEAKKTESTQSKKIDEQQLESLQMSIELEVKQKEKLDKLNEQLIKIEEALLGMSKKFDKLPKELARQGPDFSKIVAKKDATTKEVLSELVGETKSVFGSVGKGVKSTFEFAKNPVGGIKSGIKKAGAFVSDVVSAEPGYKAEADRFATERIKQENAKREKSGKTRLTGEEEKKFRKDSRTKFREIVSKEKQINEVEEKIKESKSYGFRPTEADIVEKNQLIGEVSQQKREAGIPDFTPVIKKPLDGKPSPVTKGGLLGDKGSRPSQGSEVELKNQTNILQTILQELSLSRKISEGSLEYDKAAAQYRNTSGRELTSEVTGKVIKKGGFVDFETASERLSGQSKRVRESESNQLKVLETKSGSNVEADNVQSPQEILADNSKVDLDITKESNQILKDQLIELKLIKQALTGESILPSPVKKQEAQSPKEEEAGGGFELPDFGLARKAGGALLKGAKVVGRGLLTAGKGIARFAGTGAGRALGAAAAVGVGAYTAYKGFTGAEDEKQTALQELEARVKSGEVTPEEAEQQKKQIEESTTEKKGGAVGEGGGMATGAIGGMKAGAALGTLIGGPIGTGVGALAGGALGAFAGSKIGKKVGEFGGKLWTGIKNAPEAMKNYNEKFSEVDKDKGSGLTYNVTGSTSDEMPGLLPGPEILSTSMTSAGKLLSTQTIDNMDLNRETNRVPITQPVVSTNVSSTNTTSYVPIKPSPRPGYTGSALDRHQDRILAF